MDVSTGAYYAELCVFTWHFSIIALNGIGIW